MPASQRSSTRHAPRTQAIAKPKWLSRKPWRMNWLDRRRVGIGWPISTTDGEYQARLESMNYSSRGGDDIVLSCRTVQKLEPNMVCGSKSRPCQSFSSLGG